MEKKFPLDKKEYLEVIDFIKEQHKGQFRKFTLAPYWIHPIRTAVLVMKYKQSHKIDELVIAALLHDTVEDTGLSLDSIKEKYGELVHNLVKELTSDKELSKGELKLKYLQEKMTKMSTWGLVIKLCDRLDNVSDFLFSSKTFIEKYKLETKEILSYLGYNRKLTDTHISIILDIEKFLNLF
jgi:(p)ppGpp synthase/HD superfamily hydrolase